MTASRSTIESKPVTGPPHRCALPLALIVLIITACSSTDQMPDDGSTLFSRAGAGLALSVPSHLDVSPATVEVLYERALLVPHCRTTTGAPIDIVLAEATIYYHAYYLFPENLPTSLDNIETVDAYVNEISRQDPFTYYYSPADTEVVNQIYSGDRAFIGFRYVPVENDAALRVEEVYPFTRAWFDGIAPGDLIIGINGHVLADIDEDTASDRFPSTEGETVKLTVLRGEKEITIDTAAESHIGFLVDTKTAYIGIRQFTEHTAREVRDDLNGLLAATDDDISNLILDLRGNPGGLLIGALELIDFLIDNDLPAKTNAIMEMDGTIRRHATYYLGDYYGDDITGFAAENFVLLIDADSASASEVTAAALQYYQAATVVGEQSFGKGISQSAFSLVDGSEVWIPTHYLYDPNGDSFHQIGVTPDIVFFVQAVSPLDDPMLAAAVRYLNTGEVPEALATANRAALSKTRSEIADPLYRMTSPEMHNRL